MNNSSLSRALSVALAFAVTSFAGATAHAQAADDTWTQVREAGKLRCGAAIAPPHVMRDPATGQYSGLFIDICREFATEVLQVEPEIVEASWDNIVAGLQANRWDVSLALNQTPEREQALTFTVPVWEYQTSLVYDEANPKIEESWRSLADFDKPGITITLMSGTAQDAALTSLITNATILRLPDNDATRLALISHRADVLADDSDTNSLFIAANGEGWQHVLPEPPVAQQNVGAGLRKDTADADLQLFDEFLLEKKETGEIDAMMKAYIEQLSSQYQ